MKTMIALSEIEQIYNFILEMPGLERKSNYEKILTFFSIFQDRSDRFLDLRDRSKVRFMLNGVARIVHMDYLPNFQNKKELLPWLEKVINHH
ncbi:hypothetical protein [Acinetobacter tianfuensis]|uniref:Uncharacterized protein n=1 Tax=Acinetobacter tianfuensis TaxID=2419603 RepID=A0A3A8EL22_9GAMM|nr:hypothetical protein [Acinetobacter tianfuensis]RKG29053.1 hypothetical protein D7V32_16745 [Acinetobacter tianfuensis]